MSETKDKSSTVSTSAKIGAREVVALLERNISKEDADCFSLTKIRSSESKRVILTHLERLQQIVMYSPYAVASVKSLLAENARVSNTPFSLSVFDMGIINLIDSTFDELMGSGKFDAEAWPLIAQLRVPVTKYVVQDISLLFSSSNIVRRFINNVVLALMSSTAYEAYDARAAVFRFVSKINAVFKGDPTVFTSICIDAQTWFSSNQKRMSELENKVITFEDEKNKKAAAENRVVDTLNSLVSGKALPELMVNFIFRDWRDALKYTSVTMGENNDQWKCFIRLTETMVSFVEDCKTVEGREKYKCYLPVMLKNIRLLLEKSYTDDVSGSIESLELIANALTQGASVELVVAPALVRDTKPVSHFETVSNLPEFDDTVSALDVGDWIRIKTSAGNMEACKLTFKAEDDSPWIFVNYAGNKVAKKHYDALVRGVKTGVVQVVGSGDWFDCIINEQLRLIAEGHPEKLFYEIQPQELTVVPELSSDPVVPPTDQLPIDDLPVEVVDSLPESECEVQDSVALDAAKRAVNSLQVGGWLMRYQGEEKPQKYKLAAKLKNEKFIFVNRLGVKQFDLLFDVLVQGVADGGLVIVDNGNHFNSALEKVVRHIKETKH